MTEGGSRSKREELNLEESLLDELKPMYERIVREEEEATAAVRSMAYSIGKIHGLLIALEVVREVVNDEKADLASRIRREMEYASRRLSEIPESNLEEIARVTNWMNDLGKRLNETRSEIETIEKKLTDDLLSQINRIREKLRRLSGVGRGTRSP